MREPQRYEDLFFTDDFMFCKIMENDEHICRRVIEILLGIQVERIEYTHKQETVEIDIESRGVRLDVVAKGGGRVFDLEMQTTAERNLPKRARYYQAIMDLDCLAKGQDYEKLPESFIVFICTSDPFGFGLPRYTVRQICEENPAANEKVDDKICKVYYNSKAWEELAKDDAEVRAFLKFLATGNAKIETLLHSDTDVAFWIRRAFLRVCAQRKLGVQEMTGSHFLNTYGGDYGSGDGGAPQRAVAQGIRPRAGTARARTERGLRGRQG